MKIVPFFISFCFFLLGYGSEFSVATKEVRSDKTNHFGFQSTCSKQFKTKEKAFTTLEYASLELEEDYHNDDDTIRYDNCVLIQKNSLINWYSTFYPVVLPDWYKNKPPFGISICLKKHPIYLNNKVLLI